MTTDPATLDRATLRALNPGLDTDAKADAALDLMSDCHALAGKLGAAPASVGKDMALRRLASLQSEMPRVMAAKEPGQ